MRNRWFDPNRPFAPAKWPFFYGWMILLVATLGVLASAPGQTIGISVFADVFIESLGISRTQLTTAYLLGTGLSGFLIPLAGSWFDRLGARPFYMLAVFAMGLAAMLVGQIDRIAATLAPLLPGSVWYRVVLMTLTFFFIRFLGQGLVTMGARAMLAKWWNRKRGLVTSLSGVAIGAAFSSMPAFLLWEMEVLGWRETWLINGAFLAFVMPLLAYFFFRDTPEACGLVMDGPFARNDAGEPRNDDLLLRKEFTQGEAVRTYAFWVVTTGLALQSLFSTAFVFHVLDIGRAFNVSEKHIVTFFIKAVPIIVVVSLTSGWIIEYVRMRAIIVLLGLAGTAMTIGLSHLPAAWAEWILIAGMGTAGGCFPVLSAVTYARYFGRRHLGAVSGTAMSFIIWGSALGPLLFSLSKDYWGGYSPAIVTAGIAYASIATLGLFTANPQRKVPAPVAENI